MFSSLTTEGKRVCEAFSEQERKTIVCVYENYSHDGYDEDGPKSDLYDLLILQKNEEKYMVSCYHRENWYTYTSDEPEEYTKMWEMPVTESSLSDTNSKIDVHARKKFLESVQAQKFLELLKAQKVAKTH